MTETETYARLRSAGVTPSAAGFAIEWATGNPGRMSAPLQASPANTPVSVMYRADYDSFTILPR